MTKRGQNLQNFKACLEYYRSQHRTVGCKITHMFGVPIIALSLPAWLLSKKLALQLQLIGWTLQLIGHFVFEHNKPVLLEVRSPVVAVAALVFVCEEWQRVLNGQPLDKN